MRVLVAHPGLQHSHRLALALHQHRHLAGFWSGVPVRNSKQGASDYWNVFGDRLRDVAVPRELRKHPAGFPAANRLLGRLIRDVEMRHRADSFLHRQFDCWVASKLAAMRPDVVVGYEASCANTFITARSIGATTVLDAASLHHGWTCGTTDTGALNAHNVDATDREYETSLHTTKDRELYNADYVVCGSSLAKQSYAQAGFPEDRLFVNSLGIDEAHAFRASVGSSTRCRFVYVGKVSVAKGVDLLLELFERTAISEVASLSVIGECSDAHLLRRMKGARGVNYVGGLPHSQVLPALTAFDCLVLPSRRDGFGLVVTEALSVGLAVVVSENAGAADILREFPEAGRVVSSDTGSVFDAMRSIAHDRDWLLHASIVALDAARKYSWKNYEIRVVSLFERFARERVAPK
jgi:glycosyltransferase involved in cell wall biosynthesis